MTNIIKINESQLRNIVAESVRSFLNEENKIQLNEYFDKHLTDLRNYLNKTPHEKNLFIISNGGWYDTIKDGLECYLNKYSTYVDEQVIIDALNYAKNYNFVKTAKVLEKHPQIVQWLVDYIKTTKGKSYEPCSFEKMDYIRDVKNEWLIHFTRHSESIRNNGFTKGVYSDWDYRSTLLATPFTHFGYEDEEGYNFAYSLQGNDYLNTESHLEDYVYGYECVIFQASGVEVYHHGDKDKQVIFWGPSAKNIIAIQKENECWYIKSVKTNRKLMVSKDKQLSLKNVVEWCIRNIKQYRKQLMLSL